MNLPGALVVLVVLGNLMALMAFIFWHQILSGFPLFLQLCPILCLLLVVGLLEARLTTPRPPDQDEPPSRRGDLATPQPPGNLKP